MNKFLIFVIVGASVITGIFLAANIEKPSNSILTTKNLIEGGSPIYGHNDAPVTIVEWGDYQCTFCFRFHQSTLKTIQNDYINTGMVKLVFKDFPLNGKDSVLAAQAAHCAGDQKKFWEFHDVLYNNWAGEKTGWINRESLNKFAQQTNLNLEEFNNCIDSKKYQSKVSSSYQFGKEIGIDATPSFLVFNNEKIIKIRGNQPLEVFERAISELS